MGVTFRSARGGDVGAIVALLADDELGAGREGGAEDADYARAWAAIEADPGTEILVAERGGEVVGCVQVTVTPGLSRRGASRATFEGIRVRRDARGTGVGAAMMRRAIEIAREKGCAVGQLTSDRSRDGAHGFYERLGFEATHVGFKLRL